MFNQEQYNNGAYYNQAIQDLEEVTMERDHLRAQVEELQRQNDLFRQGARDDEDTVQSLEAHNKLLREALQKIASMQGDDPEWPGKCDFCGIYDKHQTWCVYEVARQALEEVGDAKD